jgi:hypothetical protein
LQGDGRRIVQISEDICDEDHMGIPVATRLISLRWLKVQNLGSADTPSSGNKMKYADTRPYADPEKAARKLLKIANTVEAIQDGRIFMSRRSTRRSYRQAAATIGPIRFPGHRRSRQH